MKKQVIVRDEEFRMKVVQFLKIYGYYGGILAKRENEQGYANGTLRLVDIIQTKKDFRELKFSVKKVLEYCYENGFDAIERVMNTFYREECAELKKKFGSFFEKIF